jgi:hypothetical protein
MIEHWLSERRLLSAKRANAGQKREIEYCREIMSMQKKLAGKNDQRGVLLLGVAVSSDTQRPKAFWGTDYSKSLGGVVRYTYRKAVFKI